MKVNLFFYNNLYTTKSKETNNVICSNNVCSAAQSAAGVLQLRV